MSLLLLFRPPADAAAPATGLRERTTARRPDATRAARRPDATTSGRRRST